MDTNEQIMDYNKATKELDRRIGEKQELRDLYHALASEAGAVQMGLESFRAWLVAEAKRTKR